MISGWYRGCFVWWRGGTSSYDFRLVQEGVLFGWGGQVGTGGCFVWWRGVAVVIYDFRLVQESVLFGGGGVAVVIYDFRLVQEGVLFGGGGGSSSYL